jgi:geranylgeranyl diphosphate synthase type I
MTLDATFRTYLPEIEKELHRAVDHVQAPPFGEYHSMLAYHLGWEGEGAGPEASGKRIRPLLLLLSAAAAGSDWRRALPAAAAVELIHNFSLIHDDIQDNSPLRRGRPTVWTRWGIPQAINAGDAMFTLGKLAILRLEETASPAVALQAARLIEETCLTLTQGQYLDMAFETREDVTLLDYWKMVGGKTAALLAACASLGALVAGVPAPIQAAFFEFGRRIGLAYQAEDDLLGIWGDAALTGKSTDSDLVSKKKSLPVIYGLQQNGEFARRWRKGDIHPSQAHQLAALLEQEGARTYTEQQADEHTRLGLSAFEKARPVGEAGEDLHALALKLVQRKA